MSVVVTGAVFVDVKGYPDGTYIPAGRNAGRVEQVHGGVARNIVEDVANLGENPVFLSLADETGAGADVIARLKEHGVRTEYMRRTKDGMGTWLAVFDHTGDVVASISKRPDLLPIADLLEEKGDEIFQGAESAFLEIDIDERIVSLIFHYARKYGFPVFAAVSNMTIALQRRDYLRRTACLICNQQEAGLLFGTDCEDLDAEPMRALLMERIEQGSVLKMIVTMGAKGAVYAGKNGETGWYPARKVDVKDTTGAGDAFFAGAALALTRGRTLRQACAVGTAMASAVIATMENTLPVGTYGL